MLKNILSISGRPGLFRLVNRGKNMLIVESIANGKRTPAYAHDKVISLADISIYTEDGEDTLLGNVLEAVKTKTDGKPVDISRKGTFTVKAPTTMLVGARGRNATINSLTITK